MCGIFGAFSFSRTPVDPSIINSMSQSIATEAPTLMAILQMIQSFWVTVGYR